LSVAGATNIGSVVILSGNLDLVVASL
jgi:hypothetical protein